MEVTLLTAKEVAAMLRVSHAHVLKMAREGELPAIRIGKAWRFRQDVIDELLAAARP
jgi:excisionase family DNA binding protein